MKVTAEDVKRFAQEMNLTPDDLFEDITLETYARDYLGMCDADDDDYPSLSEGEIRECAVELGMVDPTDLDEGTLADMAEKVGSGFRLARQPDVEYAHDTQGHTGAVAWCREGACGMTDYNY